MNRKINLFLIVSFCWVALILLFSSQSYQQQSIQPLLHKWISECRARDLLPRFNIVYDGMFFSRDRNPYQYLEFIFRKGAHLFMYGSLTVLMSFLLRIWSKPLVKWPIPLMITAVIAAVDEHNQRASLGRTPNAGDILVDISGGLIGLILCYFVRAIIIRYRIRPRLMK